MRNRDEILLNLLRAARSNDEPAAMPFGFATRVLASARSSTSNGSALTALFARRAAALALALIALAGAGLYRTSSENSWDYSTEYGIADTAIQTNLSE